MLFDFQELVDIISGSSSEYIETFLPLFLLVWGLVLAFVVIESLGRILFGHRRDPDEPPERFDDDYY